MEKTVKYNGKEITFRCSAATPREYRRRFNSDLLVGFEKMQALNMKAAEMDGVERYVAELDNLDIELFENFAWIAAGCPGESVDEWLSEFEPDFITTIWPDLYGLWLGNNVTVVEDEGKNAVAGEG